MRRLLRTLRDARDERIARRMRQEYGRRRWLLSWQARPDGCWLARLSGPSCPETVEALGTTRREAIRCAGRALGARLEWPDRAVD